MTYLQASNRPSKERAKSIILVCGIFVVIIVAIQFFIPHFLPSFFTTIARPFWRVEFSIEQGSLKSQESLLRENADLQRQLDAARIDLQSIQEISNQNAEFLALLGRKELTTSTTTVTTNSSSATRPKILAAVLVRPPFAAYDELIIDIGADHNLRVDDKVYASGQVLIGKISDVLANTAKVTLFTTPGQSYPVLIGPSRIPATAIGRGGGQYTAQVPQASVIAAGDAVSDVTISDAPLGVVTSVIADPANPFQTVLFAPSVNVYELRWVLVENKN